jgi:hypothetical protein
VIPYAEPRDPATWRRIAPSHKACAIAQGKSARTGIKIE